MADWRVVAEEPDDDPWRVVSEEQVSLPLPAGVRPSEGRSATPMGQTDPRLTPGRRGTLRGAMPYGAPMGEPELPPGGSILDQPAPGYVDTDPRSPAKREADLQRAIADAKRDRFLRESGELKPLGPKGAIATAADVTLRKPLDNSLGGLALETAGDVVRGVGRASAGTTGALFSAAQAVTEPFQGDSPLADYFGRAGAAAREGRAEMGNPRDKDSLTQQVFESAFTQVPILLGLGFGSPALAAMGAQAAANDYGESRDRGVKHSDALERAAYMGIAEAVGERVGLPKLGELFSKAAAKASNRELGQVLSQLLVREQVGEQATLALQASYEKFAPLGRQPGMTLSDYLDDMANTAAVTLGQSLLMGGGAAVVRAVNAPPTAERLIADTIQGNVDRLDFTPEAISGYAARAGDARFYDPTFVDPQQTAANAGRAPVQAPAQAPVVEQQAPVVPAAPVAPRVEDMPTEPFTPEQTAAMAARKAQADAMQQAAEVAATEPEAPAANQEIPNEGQGQKGRRRQEGLLTAEQGRAERSAVGSARIPSGALAAASEELLKTNARQASATATTPPADQGLPSAQAEQPSQASVEPLQPSPQAAPAAGRTNPGAYAQQKIRRLSVAISRDSTAANQLRSAGVTPEASADLRAIESRLGRAQGIIDHWAAIDTPPEDEAASAFRAAVAPFEELFGREVIPFTSSQPIDGFAADGKVWVNLSNPERSIGFTVMHELQHVVRREAEAGNSQAQLATQLLDQVWGMIGPQARQAYAEKWLFRQEIADGKMTVEQALASPKVKDEMLSDFMGKRADDVEFWRGLAEKEPTGFKAFVDRWLAALDALIQRLRGRRKTGGYKDVDLAIKNLERAKKVAERVVVEWQQLAQQRAERQAPADEFRVDRRQQRPPASARDLPVSGVAVEVAPNPDQPAAQDWRRLDQTQRTAASVEVMEYTWPMLMQELGWPKASYRLGSGVYQGERNPSFTVDMPGATFEQVAEMARVLGYVLDQKAMVAFDESDTTGGSQAGFVQVIPPGAMTSEQVDSLRAHIARKVPQADGDSFRDGRLIYGNFSQWGDSPLTDQQFFEAIRDAVDELPDRIEVVEPIRFRSEYIEPASRDAYLEGTRYGGSDTQAEAGRDGVRRERRDPGRLRQLAERAIRRRDDAVRRAAAAGRPDAGSAPAAGAGPGQAVQGEPRLSYGNPRAGATAVVGYHFSRVDRSVLSSAMYGTGLTGAEADRLAGADPRIRDRVYFYIDRGTGINPEAGVGGRAHRVRLTNVYDADEDALRLARGRSSSAFELAVLEAGFDGYFVRDAGPSGVAVLVGQHGVPVEQLGGQTSFRTTTVAPAAKPRQLSAAERIASSKTLPAGQLAPARWASLIRATMPQEFAAFEGSPVWSGDKPVYKDELAKLLEREQDPAMSGREEDGDELGAFSPFASEADPEVTEVDKLTEDEINDLNAELADVMGYEQPAGAAPVKFEAPSDAALKSVGVMAESAYRDLEYTPYTDSTQEATITFTGGSDFTFYLTRRMDGDWRAEPPSDEMKRFGPGMPRELGTSGGRGITEGFARSWNRRIAASIDLMTRGFDLAAAVPPAARSRVVQAWKQIAGLRGVFEFAKPEFNSQAPSLQKLQQIADSVLGGSRYSARAVVGDDTGWFRLKLEDQKTGYTGEAQIQYVGGANRRLVMHTQDLEAGTALGKPFYQVAFAFGHAIGVPTNADPQGLLGVNNYRRTEQMVSAALRAGRAGAVNPGIGQRIYGWRAGAKTEADADRNLVRLMLAAARNAAEVAPETRDLVYDIEEDVFDWRPRTKHSQDAEAYVKQVLASKDARAVSLSRSTLARAALTFQAIDGKLDLTGVRGAATPILYSANGDADGNVYAGLDQDEARAYGAGRAPQAGDLADRVAQAEQRVETLRRLLACVTR